MPSDGAEALKGGSMQQHQLEMGSQGLEEIALLWPSSVQARLAGQRGQVPCEAES